MKMEAGTDALPAERQLMQGVCYLNKTIYLQIRHDRMQAWLANLHASASASRMEPTFRSQMQMQEFTELALNIISVIQKFTTTT